MAAEDVINPATGEVIVEANELITHDLAKKIKRSLHITPDALEVLKRHDWPGNVRELRNVLEFSAYLSPNGIITPESLPDHYTHNSEKLSSLTLAEKVRRSVKATAFKS